MSSSVLTGVAPIRRVLLVDPDLVRRGALAEAVGRSAAIEVCPSFATARTRMEATAYDLLVTSLRLEEYNGLHLVYLAKRAATPGHAVVFDEYLDLGLASEVQRAGAFYELAARLPITLPTYANAFLPPADRRTPAAFDRRVSARGGRRRWDAHLLAVGISALGS